MAAIKCCAILIGVVVGVCAEAVGDGVALREEAELGVATRAQVVLSAEGKYLSSAAKATGSTDEKETPEGLPLRAEVRLEYVERVLNVDAEKRPRRTIRRFYRGASAVNVGDRPTTVKLRAAVAIQVAELRGRGVFVYSPIGLMTRPELDLVQGPGDPIALARLLPEKPVEVGDHWVVDELAVRAVTSYDTLIKNTLEATLVAIDADSARFSLRGEVRGAVLDAEGSMACDGTFTFDRKAGLVDRLTLQRAETRAHGQVEGGLDVKSTLNINRRISDLPSELTDTTLARIPLERDPRREQLILYPPGGKYTIRHDRDWYLFTESQRQVVLKRIEGGELIAQCNLVAGPNAGKGRHQDTSQFRDDVRKGLGSRFLQFLGAGEVDGEAAGGYRYKLGVQGRQGDVGVIWYYYLIASPEGDQLLATFTLADQLHKTFGDRDEALIGTLRWVDSAPTTAER